MRLALEASGEVVQSIMSDIACGAYTIAAAIQGILMNVWANLPHIHDATLVARLRDQADQIRTESRRLLDQIEDVVLRPLET